MLTNEMLDDLIRDKEFNQARFLSAQHVLELHDILTTKDNETVMIYQDGYYHNPAEPVIKGTLHQLWGAELTTKEMNEIIKAHIIPQTYIERKELNNSIYFTCIQNGALNLVDGSLTPHDKKYKFTFKLPITYNPEAQCPKIQKFIEEVCLDKKDVDTIYELIAYCLHRDYPTAKVFVLLGGGRNGKSTLISLIKTFLGEDNIRGLSMHQLEHDTYARSHLFGRHANLNPDVGNKQIATSGAIKQLTGNDLIDTNVKHKDYFRFRNFAKLIFASNELPRSDDSSYAWMSRWIFLKFPHNFDGEECLYCRQKHDVNKTLLQELTTEEELSGLLNKVIEALLRLRNHNWDFSLSDYVKSMEKEYSRLSDPIKAFLEDCVEEDPFEQVDKADLYSAYGNYVMNIGDTPTSSNHFTQRLKQYLPNVQEGRSGNKKYWKNIRIKEKTIQDSLNLDHVDNPNGGLSEQALSKSRGGWNQ